MKYAILFAIGFSIVACQPAPDYERETNNCVYSKRRVELYKNCAATDYKCARAMDSHQQEVEKFCR